MATDAQRKLAARIGGLSLHIQHDSREIAARARQGLENKFRLAALSDDPTLKGEDLERRISLLKRRHYAAMALRRTKRRSKRRATK